MSQRRLPGRGVYHTKRFYSSDAYWSLNGSATKVLEIYYLKRQLIDIKTAQKLKIPPDSAEMVRNNGEIIFTYKEAGKYGISKGVHTRSLDKLLNVGFIDIAEIGGNRIPTKYALSDRWMKYGTPEFETKRRLNKGINMIGKKTRFKKNDEVEKTNYTRKNTGEEQNKIKLIPVIVRVRKIVIMRLILKNNNRLC